MLNAADEYRRAFACLPETNLGAYSQCLGRDDPESELLIERGRDALQKLQKAARCTTCDWGKQAQDSVNVDDFSGARCLAMLAMLRADTLFRRGDDRAGLEDLVAVMSLGRHIGQGKRVSGLAGFPLEDLAVKKAFEVLGALDSETRRKFALRLDFLPPFPDHASAIRAEQCYFRTNYRDVFAALDEQDAARSIREKYGLPAATEENCGLLDFVYPAGDPAERLLLATGGSRRRPFGDRRSDARGHGLTHHHRRWLRAGPVRKLAALRDAAKSNPLLTDELQSFDRVRQIWEHFQKRFESLRTAASGG